jgi:hypothetical protein
MHYSNLSRMKFMRGTAYHFGEDVWRYARLSGAAIPVADGKSKSSENVPVAG